MLSKALFKYLVKLKIHKKVPLKKKAFRENGNCHVDVERSGSCSWVCCLSDV